MNNLLLKRFNIKNNHRFIKYSLKIPNKDFFNISCLG